MLDHLSYRSATLEDAQAVFELILACDRHSLGEEDSDLEDLLHGWGEADLAQDAWLVHSPAGELAGYAGLIPAGENRQLEIYVDPARQTSPLYRELIARAQARAAGLAAGPPARPLTLTCYEPHTNQAQIADLGAAGFGFVQSHYQMQIKLDVHPREPAWPRGIQVRTTDPDRDLPAIHALIQAAFERPGRQPQPYTEWADVMVRGDLFDPTIWFLAFDGERLAGACLGVAYPSLGWIRQLGVLENYRRRGLGAALLRQAFAIFQARGYRRAGLGVRVENPAAIAVYEGVGMQVARIYDEYAYTLPV